MKKYFKIHKAHPNFISIDLIEDGKTVGGYIIPSGPYIEGFSDILIESIKKEGYNEYKKGIDDENNWRNFWMDNFSYSNYHPGNTWNGLFLRVKGKR